MDLWYSFVSLLPFEWAQFTFMQNALLAVLIVTPLFAMLGCLVVNSQMAFFSDAIGHAGLTGIAIGALLGLSNPLWSMISFSLVMAILVTLFRRYSAASVDTVIGIIMSFTLAIGIVILSRNGGFNKYSHYLIGDILSISKGEILMLFIVGAAFFLLWIVLFNRIFLVAINTSLARSRRIRIWLTQGIFASITALIVTISIQWIGVLVINALIILPAAASRNVAGSLRSYIWLAVIISLISGISGLTASYYWATATGATIVLFAMFFFVVSFAMRLRNVA